MSRPLSGGVVPTQWNGTAWEQRVFGNAAVANLDCGALTNGTLSAARLAANSITANKLLIGGFSNYAAWPNKGSAASSPWAATLVPDTTTYHTSVASLKLPPDNGTNRTLNVTILVLAGDSIYIDYWAKVDTGWNGTSNSSKLRFADQNGTYLKAWPYNTATTSWTHFTGTYAVAAGVRALQVSLCNDSTTGNAWFDDINICKQNPAVSIQNGAITVAQIAAGSLISASGIFGAVDASILTTGTLNAARIAAGSITADRINVTNLSVYKLISQGNTNSYVTLDTNPSTGIYSSLTIHDATNGNYLSLEMGTSSGQPITLIDAVNALHLTLNGGFPQLQLETDETVLNANDGIASIVLLEGGIIQIAGNTTQTGSLTVSGLLTANGGLHTPTWHNVTYQNGW